MKRLSFLFLIVSLASPCYTQSIYQDLKPGDQSVGFKIQTITDPTRVEQASNDYLDESKELVPREIMIHIWYPAVPNTGDRAITFKEYCYNQELKSTEDTLSQDFILSQINSRKRTFHRWFGSPDEAGWSQLLESPLLSQVGATPSNEAFPLLIGSLRPLSTAIVCEYLASHGYVVAMVTSDNRSGPDQKMVLNDIRDMQVAMTWLTQNWKVKSSQIGSFGFSGSGFSQVLMAMDEFRIKAIADIESGLFMNRLFQSLSSSNYYQPENLRVPFLHIFSKDLSKEEVHLNEFTDKMKFSERYRLILNQPELHHWDFATEGYTSCLFLENRGEEKRKIAQSFELSCIYLLKFFNAKIKNDPDAETFINAKPAIKGYPDDLWEITKLDASKPAPSLIEFEGLINNVGIEEAIRLAWNTVKNDSSSTLWDGGRMNSMGYRYLNEKKYEIAIEIFKLNSLLHPEAANWIDSLSEAYELTGDTQRMKEISKQVLDILAKKESLSDNDISLKEINEQRMNKED